MNEFSGKYGLQSAIAIWANFVTPVLLFALKQFQNKQDCGGTSTAVRLALVLKMFLLCHVVEAVYYLMKKALKMLASSVMMPASGGLVYACEKKSPDVLGSKLILGSFWFKLPSSSQLVPKPSTPRSRASSSRRRWRSCCSQTSFVRGVYQWIHEDS